MARIKKDSLIYIIDDDKPLNTMVSAYLKKAGYKNIKSYYSGEEGIKAIEELNPNIVIQDFDMGEMNGVQVLKKAKKINPEIEFIMLSGQTDMKVAIDALTAGAFDYIIKDNFAKENAKHKIEKLLKIRLLKDEKKALKVGIRIAIGLVAVSWLIIFLVFLLDV